MRGAQAMRPRTGSGPIAMLDPREMIHEARLKKRPEELDAMRRAIAISAEAHKAAMRRARGGMMEWEIEALVDYTFRSRGAAGPSYPSIIASGPNAATLHYINNDREMRTGELLLIDAGAEYDFYAADITRTFPIGARFTRLQRELYELVLDAQLKAIDSDQAGRAFRRCARSGSARAGRGHASSWAAQGTARRGDREAAHIGAITCIAPAIGSGWTCMTWGCIASAARRAKLEPGMVLTVEPGIYIAPDDDKRTQSLRGVGIRIEDDVLVTADGSRSDDRCDSEVGRRKSKHSRHHERCHFRRLLQSGNS